MTRVLHLHELPADFQTSAAVDALRADASGQTKPDVRPIGRGGAYGTAIAATIALRRRATAASFDVTHAWGLLALRVAAFGGCERIVYSPTHDPHHREIGWLRSSVPSRAALSAFSPTVVHQRPLPSRRPTSVAPNHRRLLSRCSVGPGCAGGGALHDAKITNSARRAATKLSAQPAGE